MPTRQEIAATNDQLLADGLIEPTGESRDGQPVYRITEKGRAFCTKDDAYFEAKAEAERIWQSD